MSLPELSIKRPVLAFMASALLVLFGLVAWGRLGVDRIPAVEFPWVTVTTIMPGANPDIIDSSVTSVIETKLNTVPGINHIQSYSSPSQSIVVIGFDLEKDADVAFNEVQSKINQVLNDLPSDAETPVVAKVEANAEPVMWLALQGDRTLQQLNQYARNVIKKRLETIDGVGEVILGGGRERTIRVEILPDRMAALGVTVQDLVMAFQGQHVQMPGGFLVGRDREALIKLDLEFHSPRQLEQMVIAVREGTPVHLREVALVEDALDDPRSVARYNGEPAVGIGIVKISNANTVKIVEEVRQRLDSEIRPQLPAGLTLVEASDSSGYILELVHALVEHLWLGTLLAALVVWLFLKSFRSTLIIATAIPVSLMGAIAVMYMAGYTINMLTLLALLLLIGVVVDDAIVVLENIYRHRERLDKDPHSAAINGTNQVVFAVLAATLTLVAIFTPVAFMEGIIGRFFASFGAVVAVGVLVSWFVSMSLTPMLASRYLQVSEQHGRVYHFLENGFRAMERGYTRTVRWALRYRWTVLALAAVIVYSSGYFFGAVGKTFVPDEDEGLFLVQAKTPLGSSVSYTSERMREVERVVGAHPEVLSTFTSIGGGQGNAASLVVRMLPREQRDIRQQELMQRLNAELLEIPGVDAFTAKPPMVGGGRGEPLQFVVNGPDLDVVADAARSLEQRLAAHPALGKMDLDLQLDLPQLELAVNRDYAAQLGLTARDIALAVNVLAGGYDVAKYSDKPGDGERYDIRLKAAQGRFGAAEDLRQIYLRNPMGELVRLDTVVDFEHTLGPAIISRFDLRYAANFYATPTLPLQEAMQIVEREAADLLPAGYQVTFIGEAEEFAKTAGYMAFAFLSAIVLVYMVLASQFNSFLQPVIIMVAQPLAMIGGVAALWLAGHTLNVFSMIGLVLLVGLVAKNSILLVDLANQLRAEGKGIDEALLQACPERLRPVLMTSLTVILALLPAAFGLGAGADTNAPLSVAVIGGMVTSTLLTLVVVPSVYSLMEGGLARLRARRLAGVEASEELVHEE